MPGPRTARVHLPRHRRAGSSRRNDRRRIPGNYRRRPGERAMTIWATGHNLRCDVSFCAREFGEMENYFVLVEQAERAGWALGRKLGGTRAKRGGKEYR